MRRRLRVILAAGALAVAGFAAWELAIHYAPLPRTIDDPPVATPVLEDRHGTPFAVIPSATMRAATPVSLREMGQWLPWATVAIEDHRFWEHHGVDFYATTGAALRNLRNGTIISGASTITQQVVKLASRREGRAPRAKVREAFGAMKLEQHWTKQQILESYLNRIDYGNRRFGAEAAAQAYFGKQTADLSLAEAIFLAGLPQSPTRLNPWQRPNAAMARYRLNVTRLERQGLLPEGASAQELLAHPPKVSRNDPPSLAPYFARMVPTSGQPRIRTSLDLDVQAAAERRLKDHLDQVGGAGVGDAAIVVIDNATGEIRALACAGKAGQSAINSALESRSCGSTLKPFLYLQAIDSRAFTAASLLPDTPDAISEHYEDYDPQNYSTNYLGPVRLRDALGNSLNVPAVVTLSRLGARETFQRLNRWGLWFPQGFDAYGAGFILGNVPVRLVDLAAAYAGISRGGQAWPARVVPSAPVESREAASPEACAIIADVLSDNSARLWSFGNASPLDVGPRTAVKTGTSSGFRDGWCVGFNREHTVAVWAGNLDGRPMGELLAVHSAAPLWAAMMKHLYASGDHPLPEPQPSEKLHSLAVARETGLLPRPGEQTVKEWFLNGTEPRENAASWYDASGALMLPKEYAAWCASPQNRLGAKLRPGKLAILYPREGAVFALNPHLPAGQQVLPLKSSWPNCEWFLNGKKLAAPEVPLTRGEWTLTAREAGEEAVARYSVE